MGADRARRLMHGCVIDQPGVDDLGTLPGDHIDRARRKPTRDLDAGHRPTFLTLPRALRHIPFGVGPLVESLLFTSARVQPTVLQDSGFAFTHPELAAALPEVLGRS